MRPDDRAARSGRLPAALQAQPTYAEVGATSGRLPGGYRHLIRSRPIGTGVAAFDAAVERLLTWEVHRRAGLTVEASDDRARVGTTVILGLGVGPVRVSAPCRVVAVVDEPRRAGFAYGTLPGHPETGEELFLVTREDDDVVGLRISAFSRPSTWWVRLAGPAGRLVQDRMTDRYLAAAAEDR